MSATEVNPDPTTEGQGAAAPKANSTSNPEPPQPKIVEYSKLKRRFVAIPQLNKGERAKRLATDRWEIFAACAVFTYTLLNDEKYRGVAISIRFRFSSFEEVYGGEILKRYGSIFPRRDPASKAKLTDRDRIRVAIKKRVPCFVLSWHLPERGPELDQSYFMPLSLVTRHRGQMRWLTSFTHRKDDGELRDRRFVWTENLVDEANKPIGLTVFGSCDLDNPDKENPDDCLLFFEAEPGVGNALCAIYDLLVKSEHLKDTTKFLVATRGELEKLDEVPDGIVPEPGAEEEMGAPRSVRRRQAGDEPRPVRPDETNHGGRRDKEVEPEAPPTKPAPRISVRSGPEGASRAALAWRKCANKDFVPEAGGKKGKCPQNGVKVLGNAKGCAVCNATMTRLSERVTDADLARFEEAQKAQQPQQDTQTPPAPPAA